MGKKFSEAVLTCDLKKSAVIFLIFLKADKHQFNSILFHVIFNHDFDLAADIPVEQELDHFVFILKIIIESRADHMSTIRDHFDGYLLKRHGKHKCPKAVVSQPKTTLSAKCRGLFTFIGIMSKQEKRCAGVVSYYMSGNSIS